MKKLNITSHQKKVYALTKKIPKGKVTTYNEIAKKLNTSPRAIGQALKNNPYAPIIPCHRVIKSNGKIGGFKGKSSGGRIKEKIALLKKEGVIIKKGLIEKKYFI